MKRFVVFAAAALVAACSSSSGNTDRLTSLSNSDAQSLCDAMAQPYGGYGKTLTCPYGDAGMSFTVAGPTDQASCVQSLQQESAQLKADAPNCDVTVGEELDCINATPNPCATTSTAPAACVSINSDTTCLGAVDAGPG